MNNSYVATAEIVAFPDDRDTVCVKGILRDDVTATVCHATPFLLIVAVIKFLSSVTVVLLKNVRFLRCEQGIVT